MRFEDWKTVFNRLYVCKIFPETWSQYSVTGEWKGNTNGGPLPPEQLQEAKKEEVKKDSKKDVGMKVHAIDTNDKWFNNPQYRLSVKKKTTVIISLMQEDTSVVSNKKEYIAVNFMVVRVRSKKDRLWEVRKEDIVLQAGEDENRLPQREITETLTLTEIHDKKPCHYIIVPNATNISSVKKDGRLFFLRIFASEHVDLVELPQTIETAKKGEWVKASAGGRRIENATENQFWCKNPQYFLNITRPTHIKIILKKLAYKKTKQFNCGITITKAFSPTTPPPSNIIGKDKKSGMSLPSTLPGRGMTYQQTLKTMKKEKGDLDKIPDFEPPNLNGPIHRKLQVFPREYGEESSYLDAETAALYVFLQPTQGPFIIVPSMDKAGHADSEFTLTCKLSARSN